MNIFLKIYVSLVVITLFIWQESIQAKNSSTVHSVYEQKENVIRNDLFDITPFSLKNETTKRSISAQNCGTHIVCRNIDGFFTNRNFLWNDQHDSRLANDIPSVENETWIEDSQGNITTLTLQNKGYNPESFEHVDNSCRLNDSLSLIALYEAMDGANWTIPWNLNQPMNTWHGVTIINNCVQVLNLPENNLVGRIPAKIGDLHSLLHLNLGNNSIDGTIPDAIGNLSLLWVLDLRSNQLNGHIPISLVNLSGLGFLHLENNKLVGSIPAEFAMLRNLSFLYINHNMLNGCYDPALFSFCSLLHPTTNMNTTISDGNDFDIPWEDFCNGGTLNCNSGGDVWPGDMDRNGRVDAIDFLYWGASFGIVGTERPDATADWIPQPAFNWSLDVNGINNKHQDANGDSMIDISDLVPFKLNFGKTNEHSDSSFMPTDLNYKLCRLTPEPGFKRYELYVTDDNGEPISAHGISTSIDFGDLPIDSLIVDTIGSSLGPAEMFYLYDQERNNLTLALTRIDGVDILCNGPIATISIKTGTLLANTGYHFTVNGGSSVQANGDLEGIDDMTYNEDQYDGFIPSDGIRLVVGASVTHEGCNRVGSVAIVAFGGSKPYTYLWSTGATTAQIKDLDSGIYSVTVEDDDGLSVSLTVQVNGQEPIYDAIGNLICGSFCPDFLVPSGNIVNDAQAKISLTSDGVIPAGSNVQFQAGQTIILDKGFSVQPDATFLVDIKECGGN